ncbi:hypothetical protein Tco_0235826 [Tanacetum coccineum]
MKAIRSSSHVSIVPSFSSSSHVFASPVSDRETSSGRRLHFQYLCLESVEARLLVYKKNESDYEEDIKIVDKCKTNLGYNAVPPPYTRNFLSPKPDFSFFGLEEFTSEPILIKPVAENCDAKASKAKPKAVRKNNGDPIIED